MNLKLKILKAALPAFMLGGMAAAQQPSAKVNFDLPPQPVSYASIKTAFLFETFPPAPSLPLRLEWKLGDHLTLSFGKAHSYGRIFHQGLPPTENRFGTYNPSDRNGLKNGFRIIF